MAYKSIQLDDFLATRRRKAGNLTPANQRMFGAVTDVGAFAKYLDRLIQEHAKLMAGSVLRDAKIRFDWKLINVAKTVSKDGTSFFYFDAVDRGRKSVHARGGKALAFTIDSTERLLRDGVRAAKAQHITTKALGVINSSFPIIAAAEFRRFLNERVYQPRDSRGRFQKGGRAVPLGDFSARGRISKDKGSPKAVPLPKSVSRRSDVRSVLGEVKLIPEAHLPRILNSNPDVVAEMLNDAVNYSDELLTKLQTAARAELGSIGKANEVALAAFKQKLGDDLAKLQAQFKPAREFAAGSGRGLNNLFSPGVAAKRLTSTDSQQRFLQAAKQVQNFLAKMSYTQIAAIFKPIAQEQISAFEDATPSRQENGRFKLIYTGGGSHGYEELPPSAGGQLRSSYVFMTGNQFRVFVNKVSK